ncbi:FbpB family small basic protein [Pseudobacillus badius]
MKKKRLDFQQLVAKNKEELMKDEKMIEKIEKRLESKYTSRMGDEKAV